MDSSASDLIKRARQIVEREAAAVAALADQFNDDLVAVVEMLLQCRGHVLVTGTGTSKAVAQRMAHLLSCCGTPALFINAADTLHGGAGAMKADDVVFIISKGGRSAEVNRFAEMAHAQGASTIALTEKPEAPLGQIVDRTFRIEATGDVDPYGMIATGSSLVNAAACDALCVLLLELRGYTKQQFGATHPGGAVGHKLADERE